MGKTKPKKKFVGSTVRNNPTNLFILTEEEIEHGGEDVWERIAVQLQSASTEERECGCASLAVISKKRTIADMIIEKRLLRVVAPLMLDTNLSVQHAAVGALRNISLAGHDICDHMVDQDVFTPLAKLLFQYHSIEWQAHIKTATNYRIDSKTEIFIEAINLLLNLCEVNDSVVKKCFNQDLVPVLMKHVAVERYGYQVVSTVLQCLYTLAEDCKEPDLSHFKSYDHILNSLVVKPAEKTEDLHVKLLAVGIAYNLTEARKESIEPMLSDMMSVLTAVLSQDQRKLLNDYTSSIPIEDNEEKTMEEEGPPRHQIIRQQIDHVVLGQQMALEMLANMCCGEVQNWEENSTEDSDCDETEEMIHGEEEMDLENIAGTKIPCALIETINSSNILDQVLGKANLPAENVQDILKSPQGIQNDGEMVLQMLKTLQSKAFLCLNNIFDSVPLEDLGGPDKIFQVWKDLGTLSLSFTDEAVVESATSAMRASTQKLSSALKCMEQIGYQEIEQLTEYGAKHTSATVRTNIVSILGTIGQSTACQMETKEPSASHVSIAKFLIEAASRDVELRVVAEALDKLFDMFAEDYTDKLCASTQLVGRLKQMQTGFKVKINMHAKQKCDPETRAMAVMARTNLTRFIKYKEKRGRLNQNGKN